jgi:hypothetical protein
MLQNRSTHELNSGLNAAELHEMKYVYRPTVHFSRGVSKNDVLGNIFATG